MALVIQARTSAGALLRWLQEFLHLSTARSLRSRARIARARGLHGQLSELMSMWALAILQGFSKRAPTSPTHIHAVTRAAAGLGLDNAVVARTGVDEARPVAEEIPLL